MPSTKKVATCILCLLYCTPIYADKISDLETQVAMLQEQLLGVQQDIRTLKAEKDITIEGRDTAEPKTDYRESAFMEERHKKEPRVSFKFKPGWASLSHETRGPGSQDRINTAGFAISSELEGRLTKRVSLNLTADAFFLHMGGGAANSFRINEWSAGARLYTLAPNVRYRVLSSVNSNVDLSLGYEGFFQQFRPGVDLGGHGPRTGIIANFSPTERLSFTTEGFYTGFFDIQGEGRRRTEGHAFRFDIGGRYSIYKGIELGTGYRGYLLSVDRPTRRSFADEEFTRVDHLYGYLGFKF